MSAEACSPDNALWGVAALRTPNQLRTPTLCEDAGGVLRRTRSTNQRSSLEVSKVDEVFDGGAMSAGACSPDIALWGVAALRTPNPLRTPTWCECARGVLYWKLRSTQQRYIRHTLYFMTNWKACM